MLVSSHFNCFGVFGKEVIIHEHSINKLDTYNQTKRERVKEGEKMKMKKNTTSKSISRGNWRFLALCDTARCCLLARPRS